MFLNLLAKLGISEEDLTLYRGTDLSEFNGARTTPLGNIELSVIYGERPLAWTVETAFLVLPCRSVYICIICRPTLSQLGAVASTVHLKMKFHSCKKEVITLNADMGGLNAGLPL